jgi:hypothetical protein
VASPLSDGTHCKCEVQLVPDHKCDVDNCVHRYTACTCLFCVFCVWRWAHHNVHTSPAIAVMCVLHTRNSHVHTVKMLYPGCLLASVGLVGQRSKLGTTCMTSLVFDSLSLWMYAAQFLWEPRQHTKCTCCLHKICGCMGESILRPGRILTWLGTRKKSTRAHADIKHEH